MNFFMPTQPVFMNPYMQNFQFANYNYGIQKPVSIFRKPRQTQRHNTYNKAKGDILVRNALAGLPNYEENPPMCAKYVKNAIVKSGLGEYVKGTGEDAKYMLRKNANFKEVKVKAKDMPKMPKGTIFVYDAYEPVKYADGSTGEICEYGHVTFKYTSEKSISDRIEDLPLSDHAYAFIPV
ncbi:hypothetical protein J6P92_05030 [bacterium]|nr:hypothetical protein [bacterium]